MNEIQLLRAQLRTERRHVNAVATACAAAHGAGAAAGTDMPGRFAQACAAYLACVLKWFAERDARLDTGDILSGTPLPRGDRGSAREALALLGGAAATHAGWQALALFIRGPWDERRGAIEALLAAHASVAGWRSFAGIDADSICLERALYLEIRAALPAGVELA